MKTRSPWSTFLIALLAAVCLSLYATASAPTLTLAFDPDSDYCTLTVRNTTREDITLLDAFSKKSGMTWDFPMGTCIRFKDSPEQEWLMSYRGSSNLYDHGPCFVTERESGRILARPPQKDLVLRPGASLVHRFRVSEVLHRTSARLITRENGQLEMPFPFKIKAGIFVARGDTYDFLPVESEWRTNQRAIEP